MPEIIQNNRINITVEKFLDACSGNELREVDLLIQSSRFIAKMKFFEEGSAIEELTPEKVAKAILTNTKAMPGLRLKGLPPIYYCSMCHTHVVDAENGFDTCQQCLDKQ